MHSFKAKLGIGIIILIAGFVASQIICRRNSALLHDYLSGALNLAEEMHNIETLHSSMHSMLIYARLFGSNRQGFDPGKYAQYKSEAAEALEKMGRRNVKTKSTDVYKSASCLLITNELLDALTLRFTSLKKTLDSVVLGKSMNPHHSLKEADTVFDDIFNNYYLKLQGHYDMQVERMRESSDRVKSITDIYFAVQLIIVVFAGIGVIIYMDKVVFKIYSLTERYALTDTLTSLYNRRYIERYLPDEINRSARYKRSFALAVVDVDKFKAVNDTYGHPAGDMLLKEIASVMQRFVRITDTIARYGGEEFIIIFPELNRQSAVKVAEKICSAVASHKCLVPNIDLCLAASVSIGLAFFPEDGDTIEEIMKKAYTMLYKAKSEGRNRVMA